MKQIEAFAYLLSLGLSGMALAGTSHTGGVESRAIDSGSAWFLGEEPIRYCVEVDPRFGVDPEVANTLVQSSLKTWREYVNRKGILQDGLATIHGLRLALNATRVSCESPELELRFLFGVETADVTNVKVAYENPTAIAHRESYDLNVGRGKGFIWIANPNTVFPGANYPNWQQPYALQGLLTHEWGHIFGTDHVEDTIMGDIVSYLQNQIKDPVRAKFLLTEIDHRKELSSCSRDCEQTYRGRIAFTDEMSQQTFKRFTGRVAVGPISATAHLTPGKLGVYFKDANGTFELPIKFYPGTRASFSLGTSIFKVAKGTGQASGSTAVGLSMSPSGEVQTGTIQGHDGRRVLISLYLNSDLEVFGGPLVIFYLDEQGRQAELFEAQIPGTSADPITTHSKQKSRFTSY